MWTFYDLMMNMPEVTEGIHKTFISFWPKNLPHLIFIALCHLPICAWIHPHSHTLRLTRSCIDCMDRSFSTYSLREIPGKYTRSHCRIKGRVYIERIIEECLLKHRSC